MAVGRKDVLKRLEEPCELYPLENAKSSLFQPCIKEEDEEAGSKEFPRGA